MKMERSSFKSKESREWASWLSPNMQYTTVLTGNSSKMEHCKLMQKGSRPIKTS